MNDTKIKAILFIIQYIDKELIRISEVGNYDRVKYLNWRKKINQNKLKQLRCTN